MDKEQEEKEFQVEKQDKKEQEEVFLEYRMFERTALQEKLLSDGKMKEILGE